MRPRNWAIVLVLAAFVGSLVITSAPAMADDPCENASVKANCRVKGKHVDAHLKLKKGPASTEVAFVITNGEGNPDVVIVTETKKSGKVKVRTRDLFEGPHEFQVFIVEGRVPCIGGEFECD